MLELVLPAQQQQAVRRRWQNGTLFLLSDIAAFIAAFMLALWLLIWRLDQPLVLSGRWWHEVGRNQLFMFACFAVAIVFLFWRQGHYSARSTFWEEFAQQLRIVTFMGILNGAVVILANSQFSKTIWLASFGSLLLTLPLLRGLTRYALQKTGHWYRSAVIIGCGELARSTYRAISSESNLGYRIEAFITTDGSAMPASALPRPVWQLNAAKPAQLLTLLPGWHVIYAVEPEEEPAYPGWMAVLSQGCKSMHVAPPVSELPIVSMRPYHFFSHDILILGLRNNLMQPFPALLKRVSDCLMGSLLLLALSPLLLLIAIMIKMDGEQVLFVQPRRGREGKAFGCLKFRTMYHDAEARLEKLIASDPAVAAEWQAYRKLKDDPRITRAGRLLRKTSLDELPQLFNVMRGEMSLVGPRPRLMDEPSDYYYEAVRPGITGLWQVSGRNHLPYSQRLLLDVWYVKNWNLWYDLAILIKTAKVLATRHGAY